MASTNENTPSTTIAAPRFRYGGELAGEIESRWQDRWQSAETFRTPNPSEPGSERFKDCPKSFVLDMFPYPSGLGLHVGHPLGYIATDIAARFARMNGKQVLHAMGYDAFGLPAEQYAVQTGQHPRVTTEQNIDNMRRQLRRLGLGHDDHRSVATTDVSFYKWTQWIFLQIYNSWYDEAQDKARPIAELIAAFEAGDESCAHEEHNPDGSAWSGLDDRARAAIVDSRRLVFLSESPVNWCPALGTVLANEEVTADGRSERGNYPVFKRPLKQWMMRITSYCQRLLDDLEGVDWPEPIKLMQRNWIGRSEGAFVVFPLDGSDETIEVFTTRPDTLFGATYMVMAPEHPLVDEIIPNAWPKGVSDKWSGGAATPAKAVERYRAWVAGRTDIERQIETKEKTGVFTGAYAINPVNGERIPVFIADYVMMGYGSGAIMAVPAHDERDYEFAQQFELPMRDVVYSHTAMRMREFTEMVTDVDALPEGWFNAMCDFVGMTSTESYSAPEAMERILNQRTLLAEVDQTETQNEPGSVGESRGVIREVWTESLGHLHELQWDEIVRRFTEADYRRTRGEAYPEHGIAVNSPPVEGLGTLEAKRRMIEWLELKGIGRGAITFRLRDWLFSRQRYWGEPFPIVFDESGAPHALPESMLPLELPEMENFAPEVNEDGGAEDSVPAPPLSRATEWATVDLDLGEGKQRYRRELNTMPQWAGSCWYYLRYLDPENNESFCDAEVEKRWMSTFDENGNRLAGGVDLYVGGAEHAVLHLLYARFWHKALFDLGHVSCAEPFQRLFNQGYIQAFAYKDLRDVYVDAERVEEDPSDDKVWLFEGEPVSREYGKMGKSLKNAVAPDEICERYGADTLRLYEMYLGPLEQSKPWNTRDIVGVHRFLQRLWRCVIDEETGEPVVTDAAPDDATNKMLHKTIAGVREDYVGMRFNTAIAKLIELTNHLTKLGSTPRVVAEAMTLMLSPVAPHISEELADRLGMDAIEGGSIAYAAFPVADESLLVEDEVEIPVQVMGKVRARIMLPVGADAAAMEAAAMADAKVIEFLADKAVRKVVCIPGKMVNIVAN